MQIPPGIRSWYCYLQQRRRIQVCGASRARACSECAALCWSPSCDMCCLSSVSFLHCLWWVRSHSTCLFELLSYRTWSRKIIACRMHKVWSTSRKISTPISGQWYAPLYLIWEANSNGTKQSWRTDYAAVYILRSHSPIDKEHSRENQMWINAQRPPLFAWWKPTIARGLFP